MKGLTPFVSNQLYYSLQARDIENELVPLAVDQGLGILVWSPIAGGLLSGKYRRGVEAPPGSRHLTEWSEPPVYDEDKLYDTIEELVAIGEDHGVSAAQIALAYTMAKPAVTTVIVGARNRRSASGQPSRRRPEAVGRGDGSVGQGQRTAAALPLLAPRQVCKRPSQSGRSHAAGPSHRRVESTRCGVEPLGRSRATSSPRLRTPTLAKIDFR